MHHKIIRSGVLLTGVLVGMSFLKTAQAQAPAVFTNLGTLSFAGNNLAPSTISAVTGNFNGGEIKWYLFTLPVAIVSPFNFLDIYTTQDPLNTTEGNTNTDTEIGIYNATGNLLNSDDDDGASFYSQLTYGQVSPLRTYSNFVPTGAVAGAAFDGRDLAAAPGGVMPAGNYWLATGRFNVTFNALNWGVTSNNASTTANSFQLVLGSGVTSAPEPGTMALFALGAAGIFARRKRK
jgi:PEP-CTERM motif